jgi:hypothetical protein
LAPSPPTCSAMLPPAPRARVAVTAASRLKRPAVYPLSIRRPRRPRAPRAGRRRESGRSEDPLRLEARGHTPVEPHAKARRAERGAGHPCRHAKRPLMLAIHVTNVPRRRRVKFCKDRGTHGFNLAISR